MFAPTKCSRKNCLHISYSQTVFFKHQKTCKADMHYTEHVGYVHLKKLVDNKKKGEVFASNYISTLEEEDLTNLRGCIALFNKELREQKKQFEELKKFYDTNVKDIVQTMNVTRSISSGSDASPRSPRLQAQVTSSNKRPRTVVGSMINAGGVVIGKLFILLVPY